MHRNSRRRPYRPFGYYFITTNVSEGYMFLNRNIFGFLLEHVLHLSAQLHHVKLVAYKINPDHVHLIAQIGPRGTISDYMGSWKRQFSRQMNQILFREDFRTAGYPGEDSNPHLRNSRNFKWQSSYHSHLITSRQDFDNHVKYILNQHEHHELPENKFCYVDNDHVFKFK